MFHWQCAGFPAQGFGDRGQWRRRWDILQMPSIEVDLEMPLGIEDTQASRYPALGLLRQNVGPQKDGLQAVSKVHVQA